MILNKQINYLIS